MLTSRKFQYYVSNLLYLVKLNYVSVELRIKIEKVYKRQQPDKPTENIPKSPMGLQHCEEIRPSKNDVYQFTEYILYTKTPKQINRLNFKKNLHD